MEFLDNLLVKLVDNYQQTKRVASEINHVLLNAYIETANLVDRKKEMIIDQANEEHKSLVRQLLDSDKEEDWKKAERISDEDAVNRLRQKTEREQKMREKYLAEKSERLF